MKRIIHKITALLLTIVLALPVHGFSQVLPYMPAVGQLLQPKGVAYDLPYIVGMRFSSDNIFEFTFILNKGNLEAKDNIIRPEVDKIGKYFLAALTVPEKDIWVNLSPYEQDRIINPSLGMTDLGKDMLGEDYVLKQLSSSLTCPDSESGKQFWINIRKQVKEKTGSDKVPLNAFNKIWIVPNKIKIMEADDRAVITEASLKVMTEQDYLAQQKNSSVGLRNAGIANQGSSTAMRDIIVPIIEKEVNTGKDFAQLRQLYRSIIMAEWFKKKLKNTILNQVYFNQQKIKGADVNDPKIKDKIYNEDVNAFKTGVYNLIKTERVGMKITKRQYFSGGVARLAEDGQAAAEHPTSATRAQVDRAIDVAADNPATPDVIEPPTEAMVRLRLFTNSAEPEVSSGALGDEIVILSDDDPGERMRIDQQKRPGDIIEDLKRYLANGHGPVAEAQSILDVVAYFITLENYTFARYVLGYFDNSEARSAAIIKNNLGARMTASYAADRMREIVERKIAGSPDRSVTLVEEESPVAPVSPALDDPVDVLFREEEQVIKDARTAWRQVNVADISENDLRLSGVENPAQTKAGLQKALEIFGQTLPAAVAQAIADGHFKGGGINEETPNSQAQLKKPVHRRRFTKGDSKGDVAIKLRPLVELAKKVRDGKTSLPGVIVTAENREDIRNAIHSIGQWAGMVGLMGVDDSKMDKFDAENVHKAIKNFADNFLKLRFGFREKHEIYGDMVEQLILALRNTTRYKLAQEQVDEILEMALVLDDFPNIVYNLVLEALNSNRGNKLSQSQFDKILQRFDSLISREGNSFAHNDDWVSKTMSAFLRNNPDLKVADEMIEKLLQKNGFVIVGAALANSKESFIKYLNKYLANPKLYEDDWGNAPLAAALGNALRDNPSYLSLAMDLFNPARNVDVDDAVIIFSGAFTGDRDFEKMKLSDAQITTILERMPVDVQFAGHRAGLLGLIVGANPDLLPMVAARCGDKFEEDSLLRFFEGIRKILDKTKVELNAGQKQIILQMSQRLPEDDREFGQKEMDAIVGNGKKTTSGVPAVITIRPQQGDYLAAFIGRIFETYSSLPEGSTVIGDDGQGVTVRLSGKPGEQTMTDLFEQYDRNDTQFKARSVQKDIDSAREPEKKALLIVMLAQGQMQGGQYRAAIEALDLLEKNGLMNVQLKNSVGGVAPVIVVRHTLLESISSYAQVVGDSAAAEMAQQRLSGGRATGNDSLENEARQGFRELRVGAITDKDALAAGVKDPAAFRKNLVLAQSIFKSNMPDTITQAIVEGHNMAGSIDLTTSNAREQLKKPVQDRHFTQADFKGTPEQRAMKLRPIAELATAVRDGKVVLLGVTGTNESKQAIYDAIIAIGQWAGMVGLMGIKDDAVGNGVTAAPTGNTGGLDFATVNNIQITAADGGVKMSGKKAVDYLVNGKVTGAKLAILALRY